MSIRITFIGHATVLLQDGPLALLTDPVLGDRILNARRLVPIPLPISELPQPTALLISHGHYDHLDLHSLKFFGGDVPIVLPRGFAKLVAKFVSNPVIEISHGNSHRIAKGLNISAFPVTHSPRRLTGLNYRGCNGYWIEMNGSKILFSGASAYRTDFSTFRDPDLALLSLGPCRRFRFGHRGHLTPGGAIRIMEETNARQMIPIHWGTFNLGARSDGDSIRVLKEIIADRRFEDRVAILKPGDSLDPLVPEPAQRESAG